MRGFWLLSFLLLLPALSGSAVAASSTTDTTGIRACPIKISRNFEVTGIAREAGSATVIIRSHLSKTEEVVLEGDAVFSVGTLRGVTPHGAVLKLKGSKNLCQLAFGSGVGRLSPTWSEGPLHFESSSPDAVQPPKFANEFVATMSLKSHDGKGSSKVVALDALCQNPHDLAEAIGLSPFHQVDKVESGDLGLRLSVIPAGSLLSALDVPKGAVLTQVNGFKVHTRAQVVDALLGVSDQTVTIRYQDHGVVTERSVFVH